jgi:hypothetical protein
MFTENLSPFFEVTGFAVSAQLDGVWVRGIFDAEYSLGSVGVVGLASSQPAFTLPTASVPAAPVGRALVVNARGYIVAAHEPDGTGVSRLLLEAVA